MPITKPFFSALIVSVLMHGSTAHAFADAVRVPGTKVTLTPPAGFSLAQQYPGFEAEAYRATIMVTELPTPAEEMIRAMTKDALAPRGMLLVASLPHVINGRPARLLNVRQKGPDGEVLKWILIAGDSTMTIMIVGTFPAEGAPSIATSIRHALLSSTWGAQAPDAFEGLPFRITPTSKLKLARRVSNMLTLTESGTMGTAGSTEALYLVGHSIGRGGVGDLQTFSENRAKQTTLLKNVGNFTGRTIMIDGLDAYELEGDAVEARSDAPMRLYQVIIPDETGYFIAQGLSRADRAAVMMPEFRTVTAGFRKNTPR